MSEGSKTIMSATGLEADWEVSLRESFATEEASNAGVNDVKTRQFEIELRWETASIWQRVQGRRSPPKPSEDGVAEIKVTAAE